MLTPIKPKLPPTQADTFQATKPTTLQAQTTLPFIQPNQNLQLSPAAMTGQAFAQPTVQPGVVAPAPDLNREVLETAQKKVISGAATPTLDLTAERTQELLRDPSMGADPRLAMQQALEGFDINRAQALRTLGSQYADVSHLGTTLDKMLEVSLGGARERTELERAMELQEQDRARNALLGAIGVGQTTSEAERSRFATDVGALTSVRGAAEGEEQRTHATTENALNRTHDIFMQSQNIAGQQAIAELQGKIQQGLLLTEQDFTGTQNELNRELELALSNGQTDRAIQLLQMKGDIDMQMQESQQIFNKAERTATQSWQTGERLDTQSYQSGVNYLEHQQNLALQKGDILGQERLQQHRFDLDMTMQLQDMSHDEKMLALTQDFEAAQADQNVDRQKSVMRYAAQIDFEKIAKEQGYDAAQANLQRDHETALADKDIGKAILLQQMDFRFEAFTGKRRGHVDYGVKIRHDIDRPG
jgi:hypothetical protein